MNVFWYLVNYEENCIWFYYRTCCDGFGFIYWLTFYLYGVYNFKILCKYLRLMNIFVIYIFMFLFIIIFPGAVRF